MDGIVEWQSFYVPSLELDRKDGVPLREPGKAGVILHVKSVVITLLSALVAASAHAFVATAATSAVELHFKDTERTKLVIKGETYTLELNCSTATIDKFTAGDEELVGDHPLCPVLNTGKVNGPGTLEISYAGPQVTAIRLKGLWWTDLKADIEIVLYCYPRRVYANAEVTNIATPRDLMLGWFGSITSSSFLNDIQVDEALSFKGSKPKSVLAVPPPEVHAQPEDIKAGRILKSIVSLKPPLRIITNYAYPAGYAHLRSACVILLACKSHEELKNAVIAESRLFLLEPEVTGASFGGFNRRFGYFTITRNPGSTGPIEIRATADSFREVARPPSRIDWNWVLFGLSLLPAILLGLYFIRNRKKRRTAAPLLLIGATALFVITRTGVDAEPQFSHDDLVVRVSGLNNPFVLVDAGGLPVGTPLQHTADETGFSTWVSGTLSDDHPLHLKLIPPSDPNSFLVSAGSEFHTLRNGSDAFGYAFEKGVGADAGGFSIATANHLVTALRYTSGGNPIPQELQRSGQYLSGPLLSNFSADYISEDGKLRTRIEVFEPAQTDRLRTYIKLVAEAIDDITLDAPGSLRFLDARPLHGETTGSRVRFLDSTEQPQINDTALSADTLLSVKNPWVTAGSSAGPQLAWFVSRAAGTIAGQPLEQLAVGSATEDGAARTFLTVPGLAGLAKGDMIELHLFLMPLDGTEEIDTVMADQRLDYGQGLARVNAVRGTIEPGYPRRVRMSANGIAEFEIIGGSKQTPILIDGIPEDVLPLLWVQRDAKWELGSTRVDQYQTFRASDRTMSAVFLIDLAPTETRRFSVTCAEGVTAIKSLDDATELSGEQVRVISPASLGIAGEARVEEAYYESRVAGNVRVH